MVKVWTGENYDSYLHVLYVANDDARISQIVPEHKVREPPRVNNHREELSCQSTATTNTFKNLSTILFVSCTGTLVPY